MKKLLLLFALIIPFTMIGISQVDDADAQLFGSKRPVPKYSTHNFGTISEIASHEFVIVNSDPIEMKVVEIIAPEHLVIEMTNDVIDAKSTGKFTVTIEPASAGFDGDFRDEIIIKVEQDNALGKKEKEIKYLVSGSL